MNIVQIIFLSIILATPNLFSQQSNLSTFKIGESVRLLKSDISSEADIFFYIFWDKYTCPICKDDTEAIISELCKHYDIRIILFMGDASESELEIIKKDFPKEWNIIPDELSVYAKYYGVLSYPVFYLLNKDGEILYIDKSGGGTKYNALEAIIEQNIKSITSVNDSEITYELEYMPEFAIARHRSVIYSTKTGDIYIMISGVKDILVFNQNGKLDKRIKLDFENYINTYDLNWLVEDSLFIILHDSYEDYREYYLVDVNTQNVKKIQIEKPDYLNNHNINNKFEVISNKILSNLKPFNLSKLDIEYMPFISFDCKTGKATRWGSPPRSFVNYKKSQLLAAIFAQTEDRIFALFDTDNTLYEYSINNLNLLSKTEIDFKEYSKYLLNKDIPEFNDTKHRIEFYKNVVTFDRMFYLNPNTICILANHVVVLDEFSITKYDIHYKLFFIDIESKAVTKMIELGTDNKPYFVDNKYIYVTKLIGDKMYNSKISYGE